MARVKQAKKLLDKGMSAASKKIDELLTPSELTKAQAAARRRTGRKIAKEKDPLRAFADSKDPAVRRLRAEKAAEAKARASKTRAGQRRRQAAARKEAVDKRKSQIARGAGATAGATALVGQEPQQADLLSHLNLNHLSLNLLNLNHLAKAPQNLG